MVQFTEAFTKADNDGSNMMQMTYRNGNREIWLAHAHLLSGRTPGTEQAKYNGPDELTVNV